MAGTTSSTLRVIQVTRRLALQTEVAANYIRRLGYDAAPSNMKNYFTLMPQVVLEAGLGEVSRMGIILNPFLGANTRPPPSLPTSNWKWMATSTSVSRSTAEVHHLRRPVSFAP